MADNVNKPQSILSSTLDTVAGQTQDFTPTKQICEYLNAYHVYADDKDRFVEAFHYCTHVGENFRQCLIYESDDKNAKLIGVEYMVPNHIWETLPEDEKQYWHTHKCEVKSGMLIMPRPTGMPEAIWMNAETKALENVASWYGKTFHFWQVDKGDPLPLGPPKLMKSFTDENQLPQHLIKARNERFMVDQEAKKQARDHIKPDVDETYDNKFWEGAGLTLEFNKVNMNDSKA